MSINSDISQNVKVKFGERVKETISRTMKLIGGDIWRIKQEDYPGWKFFILHHVRIILLAFRGFKEDFIQLRASALTLWTMLSIVPIVALAFAISQGFGFQYLIDELYGKLLAKFPDEAQREIARTLFDTIISSAKSMLEVAEGGVIAGFGLVFLLWTVLQVLGNIEASFNHIWQVKKSRTFARKFSDYISVMFIAPILILLSSGMNVMVQKVSSKITFFDLLGPLVQHLLEFAPIFMFWLVFTLIFIILPNTKVLFRSALIAGIITGSLFQLLQWGYINFQVGLNRNSAIYGGFAALPLFIIWLQWSWLLVLFGAEIAFAYQNYENYEFEKDALRISPQYKKTLSLLVVHLIIKKFDAGEQPLSTRQISQNLKIPFRITRDLINQLIECNIITRVSNSKVKEICYQPALSIDKITTGFVISRIELTGKGSFLSHHTESFEVFNQIQKGFLEARLNSSSNQLIRDL